MGKTNIREILHKVFTVIEFTAVFFYGRDPGCIMYYCMNEKFR